jgi:membrane protein YdbS with pleckstrin-like domain
MFENRQIEIDSLPSLEAIDWQPMHRSLVLQIMLKRLIFVAVLVAAPLVGNAIPGVRIAPTEWILSAVGVFSVFYLGWPAISVPLIGIASREKDIAYRHGVIWRSVTAVPFSRIQHVETSRGPFDRRFGTASLQLFTAGGSSGDLHVHGLDARHAERLRGFIVSRIGEHVERD